jgi:murein DD-endopeptidase MepM/ murein hydrolase activator NlpD
MTYMYPFPPATHKSQPFGANKSQGANGPGGHTGDDYAVDEGTPVRAAADGVIELSSWVSENYQDNPWWLTQMGGDTLVLNCGSTKPTFIYAHLSDSLAQPGDRVTKGQIIGYSGNTGTATTGPHTHVEVLPPGYVLNSLTYGRVDPELFFDEYYSALSYQSNTAKDDDMSADDVNKISADIATVHNTIIRDVGTQLGAIREIVGQLATKQGTPIDYARVETAVQNALAGGIDLELSVKDTK